MQFSIGRESLLRPLQLVAGAIGGRPTLPILGNVLIKVSEQLLSLTGTDLEVELIGNVSLEGQVVAGDTTVPAKKLLDICRGLPEQSEIRFKQQGDKLLVRSGRSRFSLSTLPAQEFPNIDEWQSVLEFEVPQSTLRRLMESTQFSMASQDVRYYLNGMLFENEGRSLRTVATDGHRLALSCVDLGQELPANQVIVPRKGVIELLRLLEDSDQPVTLQIGANNVRAVTAGYVVTSKLVDGRFPDYRRVLPRNGDKVLVSGRDALRQAFSRAAILSNEKFRGVRLNISSGELRITANNPEQEEAEEILDVQYDGAALEIGFNVSYVLDVLNALKCDQVKMTLADANSSAVLEDYASDASLYVVMPMRL